ncbi:type II toxin-antitoxin system MqsR family toxin [Bradyrhizobium genosp. P]|uniref:type II toxin-antitoxin system MqsR family toxin n=1 Tax=Bradyrhizobium genosp. P TaxID=83641 RepID=UPI003CF1F447
MTEKRTPHHDLEAIKQAFSTGRGNFTGVAIRDAASLGCGKAEIVAVIQTIGKGHFYKSMTSNYNARVWQDVYHVPDATLGDLYVKFTDNGLMTEFTLLSFKENTND